MLKAKRIAFCILCLCVLLLWYGASICQNQTGWYRDCISVRWEDDIGASPLQLSEALHRQEKDGGTAPPVALWKMQQDQMITGDLDERTAMVDTLEYWGDISRLYACQFQSGYWPGDTTGCVIDEMVAHTLWGSSDVLGQTLQWKESTWYVRGVIAGNKGTAFFPVSDTEDTSFSGMLMDLSEANAGALTAEQLLNQYQLPGGTITDLGLFIWLADAIGSFPVFSLWAFLIAVILSHLWRIRRTQLLLVLSVPMFALEAMTLSLAAGFPWSIPERFLPTRWSDFTFWEELGHDITDGILMVFRQPPSIWETSFWSAWFLCCVLGLLAGICALLVAFFLRKPTSRWIFAGSLLWWGGVFLLILTNRDHLYSVPTITIWVLPSVWMTLRWLLNRYAQWLMPLDAAVERKMICDTSEEKES